MENDNVVELCEHIRGGMSDNEIIIAHLRENERMVDSLGDLVSTFCELVNERMDMIETGLAVMGHRMGSR